MFTVPCLALTRRIDQIQQNTTVKFFVIYFATRSYQPPLKNRVQHDGYTRLKLKKKMSQVTS